VLVFVLDASAFLQQKEPDGAAIVLFRYADGETGFSRKTTSTRSLTAAKIKSEQRPERAGSFVV
jgi:hypothetical protein